MSTNGATESLSACAMSLALPQGTIYISNPAFWHYDAKQKAYMYEWQDAEISLDQTSRGR